MKIRAYSHGRRTDCSFSSRIGTRRAVFFEGRLACISVLLARSLQQRSKFQVMIGIVTFNGFSTCIVYTNTTHSLTLALKVFERSYVCVRLRLAIVHCAKSQFLERTENRYHTVVFEYLDGTSRDEVQGHQYITPMHKCVTRRGVGRFEFHWKCS